MNIQDAFEITRGFQSALSQPIDDDPNRYLSWDTKWLKVKMDQVDGYIYITDRDTVISIPPDEASALAQILEIADRVANP